MAQWKELFYIGAVICFVFGFMKEIKEIKNSVFNYTFVNQFLLSRVSARVREEHEVDGNVPELVPFPLQMPDVNGPNDLHKVVKRVE